MTKEQRTRINTLEWFLNFTREDLHELDNQELSRIQLQATHYFLGSIPFIQRKEEEGNADELNNKKHNHNSNLADLLAPNISTLEMDLLDEIQKILQEIINSWGDSSPKSQDSEKVLWEVNEKSSVIFREIEGNFEALFSVSEAKSDLQISNSAKIHFFHALSGFHKDNIRPCLECGKYFVHTSMKPKKFCNNKCASRFIVRQHRKEDPVEYNKKHRELLRRVYHKKKAEKAQQEKNNRNG